MNKNNFPLLLKKKVKYALTKADDLIVRCVYKSQFLTKLYYFLFNTSFVREQKSVLQGRHAYMTELRAKGSTPALLRRNIHRLEKGLIMRPRKPIFASRYIEETVVCYIGLTSRERVSDCDLQWANDVLTQYFREVPTGNHVVDGARNKFQSIGMHPPESPTKKIPYTRAEQIETTVSFDELRSLYEKRRSVRWFQNVAVEREKLKIAMEAAALAPSACNRLPYEFIVVDEKPEVVKVAKLAMGTEGFAENIPCLIAIVGDLSAYPSERDRHIIYIDGSLAAMQFMLACETLKLSTCSLNWPDIEKREKAMQSALNLPDFKRVIMLMAVGYADESGGIPFSQKKAIVDLLKFKDA